MKITKKNKNNFTYTLSSFKELKDHAIAAKNINVLKQDFNDQVVQLKNIIEDIKNASTSHDFFDISCRLINAVSNLDEVGIRMLDSKTHFSTKLLSAALTNEKFVENFIQISINEGRLSNADPIASNVELKIFLNTSASLAFLGLALVLSNIRERDALFARTHLTRLLKNLIRSSDYKLTFAQVCFNLETILGINRYQYTKKENSRFSIQVDGKELFKQLKIAQAIAGVTLLSSTINATLSQRFKEIMREIEIPNFNLSKILCDIHGVVYRINEGTNTYLDKLEEPYASSLKNFFELYIKNNEKNQLFFIGKICSDFQYRAEASFHQVMSEKIKKAPFLKKEFNSFSKINLKVFRGPLQDGDIEWSNKLYVISIKTLSLLEELDSAQDERWKVSAAVFEYKEWLKAAHLVLNKYSIEDDWMLIENFLNTESTDVEWKSSFFTPLVEKTKDPIIVKNIENTLFEAIVKTILGMLNTEGGTIIVGLVEKPELIIDEEIIKKLIIKNGKTFFDIGYELKSRNRSLDSVCLQIYDRLKVLTDTTAEKFNHLVQFNEIFLSINDENIKIVKITIKKSEKLFFSIKKENNGTCTWASLIKRADRQTITVDLRDHI